MVYVFFGILYIIPTLKILVHIIMSEYRIYWPLMHYDGVVTRNGPLFISVS